MRFSRSSHTIAFTLLLLAPGAAMAAEARSQPVQTFLSVAPVYQGSADLDRGGDFSASGAIFRAGATRDLGGGNRAGLTFSYDYFDFSFSNPTAFGGVAPWGIVQRYGIAVPLSFNMGNGWTAGVAPSFDWFKENGASTSDSLTWGATFSAIKRFDDGNVLGFGLGAFEGIEKTRVFPFVIVNWRLADRWRLVNPVPAGPSGPAGLELDYLINNDWSVGVGAAVRRMRFRLGENGPVRDGVGEERGIPTFLRVTRNFNPQMALHLYAGVVLDGRLRVENSSGDLVREDKFDPAPMFGVTFNGRF